MSNRSKKKGSSKKPDATTSDTNLKLKLTSETDSGNDTAGDATYSDSGDRESDTTDDAARDTASNAACDTTKPHQAPGAQTRSEPGTATGTDDENPANTLPGKLLVGTYLVQKGITALEPQKSFRRN